MHILFMVMKPEILIEGSKCIIDMPHGICILWYVDRKPQMPSVKDVRKVLATLECFVFLEVDISVHSGIWYQKDIHFISCLLAEYTYSFYITVINAEGSSISEC